ncbi:MAG: metallophosphoesterase [Cyanobacteriota bacterium]|nr:metallophosphoesterase [Cyanobacteriota bacterium]
MRLLQISDPHLLADPQGLCRGRPALPLLRHGLQRAVALAGGAIDLLLISGDLCHDESWQGYVRLRELLRGWDTAVALLPGNHDHPQLLRAALGRRCVVAPAILPLPGVELVLLDSHRPGSDAGWLGPAQLRWLAGVLAAPSSTPLLLALHHPPVPIGDPLFDAMALGDGPALMALLQPVARLRAVLFGHIHQHWLGQLPQRDPGLSPALLLGCPSSLCSFAAVQPCPLGRADDPGGRLLEIGANGQLRQHLLRWRPPAAPSLS